MDRSQRKSLLNSAETLVVKVGSRVLSTTQGELDIERIECLANQLIDIAESGMKVALVSSGAVAAGMGKLNLKQRPSDLAHLQAIASVGQAHLIQAYENFFASRDRHAAQILLTAEDLDDRKRYLNVRNTLTTLLGMGATPIINENDSVAVDELQTTFGDNDRLAAMVAGLFTRPALVILSDVDGVYENPDEKIVCPLVERVDESVFGLVGSSTSGVGKGGMQSKLKAAQFATRSGAPVVIANGRHPTVLTSLLRGDELGTLFLPQSRSLAPRKRWIGFTAQTTGSIVCDAGAIRALKSNGPSLLAIGISKVMGTFEKGDVVSICNPDGSEVARGLTNYDYRELGRIRGLRSQAIADVLGHCPYEEVIHRDNMVLCE